jgi:plastocyanin
MVVVGGSGGLVFTPKNLTINAGDTVTFSNKASDGGGGFHNAHSTSGPTSFKCSVDCVSNNTPNGTSWSDTVTFSTAGTVNYQCDQHAGSGMTGSITINPSVPVRLQSFDVD